MSNGTDANQKVTLTVGLFTHEKQAFENWIKGKYHSTSDALRSHIRKVTGLDPESQEQNTPE